MAEVPGFPDPGGEPAVFPQRLRGEEAEVPAVLRLQLGQINLQVLAGGGSYGRLALKEAVAGSGRQDAPVGAVLLAVGEDHALGEFAVVRQAAEEGRIFERMHYGDPGVVGLQEVAARLEGLNLVAERLEDGTPGEALGARDGLDYVRQMPGVVRLWQALAEEVGGEEVLDPEAGDDGFLKAAEFAGEGGGGFARHQIAALCEQVKDAVLGNLTDRPGVLRAGDEDLVSVVGGGQGDHRVGLAALSGFPQAAEGGFGGCLRRPEQVKGRGFPGCCRAVRFGCPRAAGAEGGFETRGDGGWTHRRLIGGWSGCVLSGAW